jgi:hypothetical protein
METEIGGERRGERRREEGGWGREEGGWRERKGVGGERKGVGGESDLELRDASIKVSGAPDHSINSPHCLWFRV